MSSYFSGKGRILFLGGALLLFFQACSQPAPTLPGSWKADPKANHFQVKTLRFEKDGTLYFDEAAGRWEVQESGKLVFQFPNVLPNVYAFEISSEGRLILRDAGGLAGEFVRAD
jgi:hypothetical protein